jgi:arylsulfatase A-like enzyme
VLSRHGAWSPAVLSVLRRVSDWDSDGYSAWFGGGDCEAFDGTVHPGALEVPRDGLDNNCVAGDGGDLAAMDAPRPVTPALAGVPSRPNLLLVTIETLRADRLSLLGYGRPTTPRLEELAKQSVVFETTYASAPSTRLSLAALLSGRLPSAIKWLPQAHVKQMRRIATETPWLPSRLADSGYFTAAVHTDFRAFTAVESAGFDRGFERFDTSTRLAFFGGTMQGFPAAAQVDRSLALLDEAAGTRPWFLWTHFVEPHYLYEQPVNAPRFGGSEADLYDAEIAEADRQVGRLVDALRQRGLLDSTLILVLGDHGEEFGEHGARFHGSNLYEPQVRTAALLRIPGFRAQRVREAISFVDLMPTLLDLMGLRSDFEPLMGRNLVALLLGQRLTPGLFIENFRVNDGTRALLGFVEWPLKLIYSDDGAALELYDVQKDPLEQRNLYSVGDARSRRLEHRLHGYLESGVRTGRTRAAR